MTRSFFAKMYEVFGPLFGVTLAMIPVLFIAGLTACSDSLTEPVVVEEAPLLGFGVEARLVNAYFPVGLGSKVDPSNAETFGVKYAYQSETVVSDIGPDGKFELLFVLGEHELRWLASSADSLSRIAFTGALAPRAVHKPSISFGPSKVVANVATVMYTCLPSVTPTPCWTQRGKQVFAGEVTDLKANTTTGRFRGLASGVEPFEWYVVRAAVSLSGVCDPNRLNTYMVVEARDLLAQYLNTDPSYVAAIGLGDAYVEVVCRPLATPAYSVVPSNEQPARSIWRR